MKIALVHDYLREYGGAERVVEVLHEIWPEAPLFTSFVDWENLGDQGYRFKNWDIRTSWVQGNPIVKKFISPLRFLAPLVWGSFDLSEYNLVVSSSGWFMCRGINMTKSKVQSKNQNLILINNLQPTTKKPLHICYIHHPPRNLYGYATGSTLQKYLFVRWYAAIINFFMRHYDFETAQKVDYFISNSRETQRRVEKFYRRESDVIYPPIELSANSYQLTVKKKDYYLSVGRLGWAKRVDLAIEACNQLKLPLKIVGVGKEMEYLKSIAGPTIDFMGGVSDEELAKLYANAKALIFCALDEDFGMVPVEAMAHGTPVIALSQGGVKETVIDGKTGIFFDKPEINDLKVAIEKFENSNSKKVFGMRNNSMEQAQKFSKARFKKEIVDFVKSHI